MEDSAFIASDYEVMLVPNVLDFVVFRVPTIPLVIIIFICFPNRLIEI